MTQLHFNYKDVFRALRLGFSGKKVAMMVWGLFLAMVGYVFLSYIAYMSSGWTASEIWYAYRLFPVPEVFSWYGWIVWSIGAVYALFVIMITGTAISKVTFEQLKGDEFFQMSKAFQYAMKQAKSIIMSPLMVVLFILSIVVAGLILSLLGAIPYFGEIFTGLMIIPAFAASLFIVYLIIILIFTLLFAPAIVATTSNDTFDTLFEVFSIVNDQPARLIWYSAIVVFLSRLGTAVLAFFSRVAINICGNILSVFMGEKIIDVLYNAASTFKFTIPYWCPEPWARFAETAMGWIAGPMIFSPLPYVHVNTAMFIASILAAVAYYLVILFVVSFGATIWFAGSTATYLVITKKKDDKNLLETKEEAVNTEITTEPTATTIQPASPSERGE